MKVCPVLLKEPQLLHGDLQVTVSTAVYIGKSSRRAWIPHGTNVYTTDEQGGGEVIGFGAEFDQKIEDVPSEVVREVQII
jgi:hypothetical protein